MIFSHKKPEEIKKLPKIVAAICGISLLLGAAQAWADQDFRHNHPRRAQVNRRLNRENHRINHAEHQGRISQQQAHQLHQQVHQTRMDERAMAQQRGGTISHGEQHQLNRQENGISNEIGR